jgi:hypothetical protein
MPGGEGRKICVFSVFKPKQKLEFARGKKSSKAELTIPNASNQFSSEANGSIVLTVRVNADFLRHYDWLQRIFHFTIRVDVCC